MIRLLRSIVLMAFLSCSYNVRYFHSVKNNSETIKINEELGTMIDSEERLQYGLFPSLQKTYKEAYIYDRQDGGCIIEIITENKKLIYINDNLLAVEILRDYINCYPMTVLEQENFEERWAIVNYDNLGQPITKSDVSQHQKRITSCLGCGCVGGLAGFFIGAVIGLAKHRASNRRYYYSDVPNFSHVFGALTGIAIGLPVGAVSGYLLENWFVLQRIKKSRGPFVVEKF